MQRWCGLILMLALLAANNGCGGIPMRPTVSGEDPLQACREFLDRLDEAVVKAGVRDASSYPIAGFPYLRSNRFLEALGERATTTNHQAQWQQLMAELDLEARSKEVQNLPETTLASISPRGEPVLTREGLLTYVRTCSSELSARTGVGAPTLVALRAGAHVPDEYSLLARSLGLFPFASLPVTLLTERAKHRVQSWYASPLENRPILGKLEHFAPSDQTQLSTDDISRILRTSRENPLQVHSLSEQQEQALAQSLAPVFWQDVAAAYDVPGRVISDGEPPTVDPDRPTVYYYSSEAIVREQPVFQMNYVVWYAARAGNTPPWIERGRLDGLTLRVSLDSQGKPFMLDAINNCGCYHFLVPQREVVLGVKPRKGVFPPLVPQWLPEMNSSQRFEIRVSSGWHQVERILATDGHPRARPYELVPYASLESFRDTHGATVSLFDSRGLVRGSERPERFLLFGMGIPHIGNMRQRGHHAIDFGNPEHFDDPYLFEKLLIIVPGGGF
jgi:hypothetical protein